MALINCVDCDKRISDLSYECLGCGCPVKHSKEEIQKAKDEKEKKEKEKKEKESLKQFIQLLCLAIVFILFYRLIIF